jgi:ABC-type Zn uptake system ZnuABC Zn-binding protein ZnuA
MPCASHALILPRVVVSTEILQPLTDSVLHGITRSSVLLKKKQDIHHARLSPSQVAMLESADIFIVPDRSLTRTLTNWYNKIEARGGMVLALTELQEAQAMMLPNGTADPHIWLDPLRMAAILPAIAEIIARYSPEIRTSLHANAQREARHIRATLVPEITRLIKTRIGRTGSARIFAAHPAYRYFTERFALGAIAYYAGSEHAHVGAKSQLKMMETIKQVKPDCIITDGPSRRMKQLADSLAIPLYMVRPTQLYEASDVPPLPWITHDYDRLIYNIAERFSGCIS